jgi:hypothetical protein
MCNRLRLLYRWPIALDNPDLLEQIPCYCGCEKMLGHKHNLDCYISAFKSDGSVAEYTDHAAYCMDGPHQFRVHLRTNDPAEPEKLLLVTSNWVP